MRNLLLQELVQQIAQALHVTTSLTKSRARQSRRLAEPHDEWHVLRAWTNTEFVPRAERDRVERHLGAAYESSNPLGRVKLVAGKRQHIHAELAHVNPNLTRRLCRVRVQDDASSPGQSRNVGNGLNRADFVIRVHDRNERRVRTK